MYGMEMAMRQRTMVRPPRAACFETFEEVDPDDEAMSVEDALVHMGLMERIDADALLGKYRSAVASRFRKIGLAHRFSPAMQEELDQNTHIKKLFVADSNFFDEVISAWCVFVDGKLAKQAAAKRAVEADGFKLFTKRADENFLEGSAIEFDEATGMPKVPLVTQMEDPNQKGFLYAIAMDWLGGPEIDPYKRVAEPPFQVRGLNLFGAFEASKEVRQCGHGLVCFNGCLEYGEDRVTVSRARELMEEAGCLPGSFRDLARHLTPEIIGAVATGRPIAALLPESESGIACFSLSPGFGVTLDIACANGPGFPKGTRCMAVQGFE